MATSQAWGASVHHSTASSRTAHSAHATQSVHAAHNASAAHGGHAAQASKETRKGSHARHGSHIRKASSRASRPRGQQSIDSERVTEIQQALIREHYLTGEASGKWDEDTKAAMQKYQADQGWQTKLTPDSRALKKLGLGPDYSNAINAKNSSFAFPPPVSTISPEQSAGFAAAAGVTP